MLKKIFMLVGIVFSCCLLWIANNKPLFYGYSDTFEVYSGNSSNGFITVDKYICTFIGNKSGESCTINANGFDLDGFLSRFNASVVLSENIAEGRSVYAYSSKIKYCELIRGHKVNLQVFIPEEGETVSVGSPLIYGSF